MAQTHRETDRILRAAQRRRGQVVRTIELTAMFIIGPLAYFVLFNRPWMLFPALWLLALTCLFMLLRDRGFRRERLCRAGDIVGDLLRHMLPRFVVLAVVITVFVWLTRPEMLFNLIRDRPMVWAIIMVGYPIASVYPQELIWRTFFFRRYRRVFRGRWTKIAASAAAFGFVHIVFHNWMAVVFTLVGGVLFADTYARTKSTLATSIEHALYGCFVFTIGLGRYFYSGAGH